METVFWIGPYEDLNVGLIKIPGLIYNSCNDQPCTQYEYKLYDKPVIYSIFNKFIYIMCSYFNKPNIVFTTQSTYKSSCPH